ncbi:unnamed protein product [Aureobasidium mustum]|uniref:Chaperone/heat shock protein Hsp12 n=1 Tax=Aureobasidium mustum TaxID=2773714 RepID=A0A9N8P8D2_9PEZI|nr:unnamed protein product [Aureobasidium mustum]
MSTDFGRKDLSDKIEEKITPQSAKGPIDVTKEHATGHADHIARDLKTDEHKSTGQSMHDKVSRMTNADTTSATTTTGDHKSVVDKVKDAIPGLHSDKRSDAAEVMDPNTSTTTSDYVNKNI